MNPSTTKSEINQIRKGIQNGEIKPIDALNRAINMFDELMSQFSEDSMETIIFDIWLLIHKLSFSATIQSNSYNHNRQFMDANIEIMGNLIIKLQEKMNK